MAVPLRSLRGLLTPLKSSRYHGRPRCSTHGGGGIGYISPHKVTQAASSFPNFNTKYIPDLIAALSSGDTDALNTIPGVSSTLIATAGAGLRYVNLLAFRNVWITAAALCGVAAVGCLFLINPTAEFTRTIDAPIETEEELQRAGIMEKKRLKV